MPGTDAELVRQCLRGRQDAMTRLVEQYQGDVLGVCLRLLGNRHDAEDVAQETFLRVFRSLHRWDVSRPLKPWIVTIAINRCRTHLRARGRKPVLLECGDEMAARPVHASEDDLHAEIRDAVNALRPEHRWAFILFHEQGLAYEFIAQSLRRPVGTIKTWLHRARMQVYRRLRERRVLPEVDHDVRRT